jgi:hypothetical protein
MDEYLKEPVYAALFAGVATVGYIHMKAKMNNEPPPVNSVLVKPAVLVGLLVYFIVQSGVAARETISIEPF